MSSKTTTKQEETQKSDPWAPAIPFLTKGLETADGIFNKHREVNAGQQAALDKGSALASQRLDSGIFGKIGDAAGGLLDGAFGPKVNPVATPTQPGAMTAPNVQAATLGAVPQVSGAGARALQGGQDPSAAISKVLSGQVDNPQLAAMADAATRQGQRNFGDAVEDSTTALTESILPAIRSGAQMSGGYGGNRQGLAEGRALAERERTLGRGARDLGIAGTDAAAGLYGSAYESAQNRMAGMADSVDGRATQMALANADRTMQGGMFDVNNINRARETNADYDFRTQAGNIDTGLRYDQLGADVGFQNNEQEMQRSNQTVQQMLQGTGMFGQMGDMQDADIQTLLGNAGFGAEWEQSQFAPYLQALTGVGGMGGQSTGTSTGSSRTGGLLPMMMAASMFMPK